MWRREDCWKGKRGEILKPWNTRQSGSCAVEKSLKLAHDELLRKREDM